MKTMYATLALATWILIGTTSAFSQACPNWSKNFDKITNQKVLAGLHQTNWDEAIAASGGPEAVIASSKVTLKDAQQRLKTAALAAQETTAGPGPVTFDATWGECASNTMGAFMAAKCEYLNMSEPILTMQGMIEIAECRANR